MISVVLTSFTMGIILGLIFNLKLPEVFPDIVLMIMLFFIGYDLAIGVDYRKIGKLLLKSVKLVVATVFGSGIAGFILALAMQQDLLTFVAAALGMGWYSLTGPLLLKFLGSEPGLLGFLTNILREIFTFIFYPVFYRYANTAAISIAGATSMDTTLPLIRETSGSEAALIALAHGWLTSLLAPAILAFVLSLG